MESNPWALKLRTTSTWGGITKALAKASGCSCIPDGCIARCLKQLSVDELIKAQGEAETNLLYQLNDLLALFEPWTPTQGSDLVPNHPLYMFQRGLVNPDISIINGFVKDEGLMFIYEAMGSSVSKLEYAAIV